MIAPYRSSMLVTYSTFPVVVLVFVQSISVIITGKCNSEDHDQLTFPTVVPERVVFSRYKWKVALAFHPYLVSRKTFGSIAVSILACHAGDRISFPIKLLQSKSRCLIWIKYLSETFISLFLPRAKANPNYADSTAGQKIRWLQFCTVQSLLCCTFKSSVTLGKT